MKAGRSSVLWCAAAFITLQLAYFPLASRWPQLQDAEFGLKLANLRAQVEARDSRQPCAVMFGSSLTGLGFKPNSMAVLRPGTPGRPVVFNFGINSSGPIVQLLCLRRLIADGIRPDLVLLEAHPWFLYPGYNHVAGKHYLSESRLQLQDLAVLRRYDPEWSDLLPAWLRQQWLPWYSHRHNLQRYFLPHWVPDTQRQEAWWRHTDPNGWEHLKHFLARAKQMSPAKVAASVRHHVDAMNHACTDPLFEEAYRELVNTCRAAKVDVVLVRMPETSHMRAGFSPETRQRIERVYADLARTTGIPIIDARDWLADEDLCDGFHHTPAGASSFSKQIESNLLLPRFGSAASR
jgi:hypothetical protein